MKPISAVDATVQSSVERREPRLVRQEPLLRARGVCRKYGRIVAVDNVGLEAFPGEILGIVGESGSGKSTLLRMLNLQEPPDAGVYELNAPGLEKQNLFGMSPPRRRAVQNASIGIVYQHPALGLRLEHTSSGNVAERLIIAGERKYEVLREKARSALTASDFPMDRLDELPLRLSGGMQQRVQLAKAVAMAPLLLLLDEPTSGLDVSVQAKVLDTLKGLQRETHITMILVSHDLGVIRTLAERVMVMRRGRVVESGLVDQVFEDPQEPYTQELVSAKL
jgi:putative phosphonate transport system ATP-binding protein